MLFGDLVELKEGQYLYEQGDSSALFWFVLVGKLEIHVKSDNDFKFSKNIDESTFFGKKQYLAETRSDFAKVTSPTCVLL